MIKYFLGFVFLISSTLFISCNSLNENINYNSDAQNQNFTTSKNTSEIDTINYVSEINHSSSDLVKLYLYSASADKYFYVVSNINKHSNNLEEQLINLLKSTPHNSLIRNIPLETEVNSLSISNDSITLDLNSSFLQDSNWGNGIETKVLQSIANTLGDATGLNKIFISLDGKPYIPNSLTQNDVDYFVPSLEGISQFNVN